MSDEKGSWEDAVASYIEVATAIRNGTAKMPDITDMEKHEQQLLFSLITDDAFYDFWSSMKGKSREYVRALCKVADAQEEYEKAEEAYRFAMQKYRSAQKELVKYRDASDELNAQRE